VKRFSLLFIFVAIKITQTVGCNKTRYPISSPDELISSRFHRRLYKVPQSSMVMTPEVRPDWSRALLSIFWMISLPSITSPKTT
jgi:hypothetical protein